MTTTKQIVTPHLDEFVVYPAAQIGGTALAVYLEPESKYGLCRIKELEFQLTDRQRYPILRIEN